MSVVNRRKYLESWINKYDGLLMVRLMNERWEGIKDSTKRWVFSEIWSWKTMYSDNLTYAYEYIWITSHFFFFLQFNFSFCVVSTFYRCFCCANHIGMPLFRPLSGEMQIKISKLLKKSTWKYSNDQIKTYHGCC